MAHDTELLDRLSTQAHRMELLAGMICSTDNTPDLGPDAWDGLASMLDECADALRDAREALRELDA